MKFTSKPLKDCYINQLFGANNVDFYKKMGLKGHNGHDFHALTGTPCFAVFDGTVTRASSEDKESLTAGRYVYIESDPEDENGTMVKYQVVYFHLEHAEVKAGDRVKSGQRLGTCDNTGQYTTGAHLHFGLYKLIMKNGAWVSEDINNGFGGAIDPEPFFEESWLINSTKKQTNYDILMFEGKLLKEEGKPEVYLCKGGKICLFPDELILWSNGYSLSQVTTVSEGAFKEANVGQPIKIGKAIDAQSLKEMLNIFGSEPERAKLLFKKYF
jgi:hypothetical protein